MLRTVTTKYGQIRGLPAADPRITAFKGIPFAAPPVGENRWRAPQPVKPWDGVLEAYEFGPISVQDQPAVGTDIYCREWHVDKDIPMDEDCLYLNVWTNANSEDDNLPVLVWFFGGGFQWGYTAEMEFDGERIARRGVVVVSVNYRLAALGFLAHPQISKEQPDAPGNWGSLDQHAGLSWVAENIKAFGGDPNNITIAGQSAGGASVMTQMAAPSNKELIHKAVVFSGMIRDPFLDDPIIVPRELKIAEKWGEEFFEYLGVKTLEEARKIPALTIRDKYAEFVNSHPRMSVIIDGQFIKEDPYTAYINGRSVNVPVMAGNTADEFYSGIAASSEEELKAKVKELYPEDYETFLSFPEVYMKKDGRYAPVSVVENSVKAAFMKRGSNPSNEQGFYYRFNPDIPGWDNPGTFHSVDLWFFFETLAKCWRPFIGRHYDLARKMCDYFANFIKTGNPNGMGSDGVMLPTWNKYSRDDRNEMEFTADGPVAKEDISDYKDFLAQKLGDNRQAFNPYLPSWEYIPDGEPHVFGDRVYIYGSHDYSGGHTFCPGDYVCYSAPVKDLKSWKYEGVIFKATDEPENRNGLGCLYAPDVAQGPDGRYYLYYVIDRMNVVSVAVCDTPAGKYKFLDYVRYADGTRLGEKEGDEPQFDPGVLTEGDTTYLYTGFCGQWDNSRHGSMCTVLDKDMITVKQAPKIVVPSVPYSKGTSFEKHAFFEASSIRKVNGKYYFIYSTEVMHELGYAVSVYPDRDFEYRGVLISNSDIGIDSYKEADKPMCYATNNHGSIEQINSKWYVFYHRHTNGTWFSRQDCAEEIKVEANGNIPQVSLSSCGLNGGPLRDTEEYSAHIACNLYGREDCKDLRPDNPKIVQDGADGTKEFGYITQLRDGFGCAFKYFDCKGVKGMYVMNRGYSQGEYQIRTSLNGEVCGSIRLDHANRWERFEGYFDIPDGVNAIYLEYVGPGDAKLKSFGFIH